MAAALAILRSIGSFLRRVPWQVWALLALIALGWWLRSSGYDAGQRDANASWTKSIAAANAEADRQALAKEEAARQHNIEVRRQYEADIAHILADRDSLARRLRNAQAATGRCPLPEAADRPGAADAGAQPGGESGAAATDAALDAYDQACRLDAAQLTRLIEQLRPQL